MNIEKHALLDHAERCRRVAADLAHHEAARRLWSMADEYEARAARLDDEGASLKPSHNGHGVLEGKSDLEG